MKKKKKSGLSGGTEIVSKVKETVKSSPRMALEFGSAAIGLVGGSFGMKQIPSIASLPAWANRSIPGVTAMLAGTLITVFFSKNSYVKSGAMGLGLAGFVDLINKNFGDKIPAKFALPQLSGLGHVQNYGEYPPEYFTRSVNGYGESLELGEANRMQLGEVANPLAVG